MKRIYIIIFLIISTFLLFSYNVPACKDIIACGNTTGGDYNLLLKVRDPSRPGLQVLCLVPHNYEYTYHTPWTGKEINFKNDYKYIGVTTKGDVIPNIVKSGMVLTSAGLCFGDADSISGWVNPTRHAWDDFDWIRYACEKAKDEEQAVRLLTKDVVKKMHAPGVSENLFVVGPNTGYVIEADAFRYDVKKIENDVAVMSNYPKELWRTQTLRKLPISWSFYKSVEKNVKEKGTVRLGSLYAVRVVSIEEDCVYVKPVYFTHRIRTGSIGTITKIGIGERKTVGYFSVKLVDINTVSAKLQVTNKYQAWENEILNHIKPKIGKINERDMMNWSRLHKEDMNGLRPMCEENFPYEAVAIYKIPYQNYETLSIGWFSPNHACSSIYVPFHICDNYIYDPYETDDAAEISLELLEVYGHDNITTHLKKTENVFLTEIKEIENYAMDLQDKKNIDVSVFLTNFDTSMQKQAYYTEQLFLQAGKENDNYDIKNIVFDLWEDNYYKTIENMINAVLKIDLLQDSIFYKEKIVDISLDIISSYTNAAMILKDKDNTFEEKYYDGLEQVKKGDYIKGFDNLKQSFLEARSLLDGQETIKKLEKEKEDKTQFFIPYVFIMILAVFILVVVYFKRKE